MTLNRSNRVERSPGAAHDTVVNRENHFAHDVQNWLAEYRIVRSRHTAGERVLDGKHTRVHLPAGHLPCDLAILSAGDGLGVRAECALHCRLAEGAELTLKGDA